LADEPQAVLVLTQEAHAKYGVSAKAGTLLFADSDHVEGPWPTDVQVFEAPITRTAVEITGRELAANVVAIGLLSEATGVLSHEAVTQAVRARVPKGTEEMNLKALDAGREIARRRAGCARQ